MKQFFDVLGILSKNIFTMLIAVDHFDVDDQLLVPVLYNLLDRVDVNICHELWSSKDIGRDQRKR